MATSARRKRREGTGGPPDLSRPAAAAAGPAPRWVHGRAPLLVSLAVIAAVGLACYANSLSVPFAFDDAAQIVVNSDIRRFEDWSDVVRMWRSNRFLTEVSLAANYRVGRLEVRGYHVVNIAIHVVTAWLVWWLLLLVQRTPVLRARTAGVVQLGPWRVPLPVALAATGALVFVSHPIQTQAVTYIIQRAAALAALF
ncbi:MAG TPA: hypothetical protein VET66_01675, partial [Steroidobacteraceae bacterium]|nr:hypothetical protein [Steroidobacteraceae bacterium]